MTGLKISFALALACLVAFSSAYGKGVVLSLWPRSLVVYGGRVLASPLQAPLYS